MNEILPSDDVLTNANGKIQRDLEGERKRETERKR